MYYEDENCIVHICMKCGFKCLLLDHEDRICSECGGEFTDIEKDDPDTYCKLDKELGTIYKHGTITNTLTSIEHLPKLEEILDKYNIPHNFDYDEVLRVIKKQDDLVARLEELERKDEKRKRANGILPGMNISCPYCKSKNVRKINFTERMIDLGGKKLGKQWHCMSCGSDF